MWGKAKTPHIGQINEKKRRTALFVMLLNASMAACVSTQSSAEDIQNHAATAAWTSVYLTMNAFPTATPPPPTITQTATATIIWPTYSPIPTTPTTATSPYEAEHEAIKKVVQTYFDKIYYIHHTYEVKDFGDVISTAPDGRSFLKTELRKQALNVVWERTNLLRYSSYSYSLDFSEIVVFDAGQMARANLSEGNHIVYDISIPYKIGSQSSGIKHIIILRYEQGTWKIIYDVHDDHSHRSLYDPTPLPKDVLDGLDKSLIDLGQGKEGPALPKDLTYFIPSDPEQLNKWKDYENALAEKLMSEYPRDTVFCEWELTEKTLQKINVWASCMTTVTSPDIGNYYFPVVSLPAVINLTPSGEIQSIETPEYGETYLSDIWRLFPNGVWKTAPNVLAMERHLNWRRVHFNEPPLVVLNATAILTPSPTVTPTP